MDSYSNEAQWKRVMGGYKGERKKLQTINSQNTITFVEGHFNEYGKQVAGYKPAPRLPIIDVSKK